MKYKEGPNGTSQIDVELRGDPAGCWRTRNLKAVAGAGTNDEACNISATVESIWNIRIERETKRINCKSLPQTGNKWTFIRRIKNVLYSKNAWIFPN